jgi:hypothetical protein
VGTAKGTERVDAGRKLTTQEYAPEAEPKILLSQKRLKSDSLDSVGSVDGQGPPPTA